MSLFAMPHMARHVDGYLAKLGPVGAVEHHMLLANSSREMKRLFAENQAQRALLQQAVEALVYHTQLTGPVTATQVAIHAIQQHLGE